MNEFIRFDAAQDRLTALRAEATRQRQLRQSRRPSLWRHVWRLGQWRLSVRLSHTI